MLRLMEVGQSREWSSALGVVAIEKGAFGSPSTKVTNFIYLLITWIHIIILTQPNSNLSTYPKCSYQTNHWTKTTENIKLFILSIQTLLSIKNKITQKVVEQDHTRKNYATPKDQPKP